LVWSTGFEFVHSITAQPHYGREPEAVGELYLEFWFVGDFKFLQVSIVCGDRPFEAHEGTQRTPLYQGIKEALMSSLVSRQAPVWLQQHAKQDEPRSVRKA